jgi:hypothetical protein
MSNDWFETSRSGLRKQAKERGAPHVFLEVAASNPLDEREAGMTSIAIEVEPIKDRPLARVAVEDDSPVGFRDLSHAYTIFAESYKRGNPELRGQFNFGEKLFLSLCKTATISTTTGTVVFNDDGRHDHPRKRRERGTRIDAEMEITREEIGDLDVLLHSLLLSEGVSVTYNGRQLRCRRPVQVFEATLPTQVADEEGVMRPTARKTVVRLYDPRDGERPHLYELGIPVVETDIRWHVSIGQKVPLNRDRDNVTPAYLRKLSTAVAEAMRECLDKDDAGTWGNIVLADREASPEVIAKLMDERFGKLRASYDPSDPEANIAGQVKHGGTIVHGGMLTGEQWENVKEKGAIMPAGKVWPTPKPYSDDPDAPEAQFVDRKDWTPGMVRFHDYLCWVAAELLGVLDLKVRYPVMMATTACYQRKSEAKGIIDFNVGILGFRWFDSIGIRQDELTIHELAHHRAGNHYSEEFHEACCTLGAGLKRLAVEQPAKMAEFTGGHSEAEKDVANSRRNEP